MRALAVFAGAVVLTAGYGYSADTDESLRALLKQQGFTGNIEAKFSQKLGRTLDPKLVDIGRLVFFDKGLGIHQTNSCSGCHSPLRGFGDSQPIAIGVGNNNIVGPGRTGARNQRRTPMLTNIGLYPALMWNGRFSSLSGDPFDNKAGYLFPIPESRGFFPPNDPRFPHLLDAQAHIPFTELTEMAGFGGLNSGPKKAPVVFSLFNSQLFPIAGTTSHNNNRMKSMSLNNSDPNDCSTAHDRPIKDDETCSDFKQFDDVPATQTKRLLPEPYPEVQSRNNPIRHRVIEIINGNKEYRTLFGQVFSTVEDGNPIEFYMIGQAIAEFELSLTFANAPIDRYARGDADALTPQQKQGATLFFGKANCVSCHAVSGTANEMFSDFKMHNAGIPAISPIFGVNTGNVPFRDKDGVLTLAGPYDMGLFDITSLEPDRFRFRTSPLRNLTLQANYFHNGAFEKLEDAMRYHLDATANAKTYKPENYGVPPDLRKNTGDPAVVLEDLDPLLSSARSYHLTKAEEDALIAFVRDGLLDPRAKPDALKQLIPTSVPSGQSVHQFN